MLARVTSLLALIAIAACTGSADQTNTPVKVLNAAGAGGQRLEAAFTE